ncbi:methyltransferase domain-containing protein [Patescibacteria group bacterium]|nr:methyltransferase domain-containing protein [Patescibacteria group bacterium]
MLFNQSKQKYGFVLGHAWELSKAEIENLFRFMGIAYQTIFLNEQVFIIETNNQITVQELQERLGGTVKISHIANRSPRLGVEAGISRIELKEAIGEVVKNRRLKIKDQKYQFGFSIYGKADIKDFKRIGLEIKKQLKERGVKSRFVVSKEPNLSSVIVQKEKLLDQGVDVVIIPSEDQFYLGYTLSVQKFEDYSKRDYGRPQRDDKSGLLPPKLAKMMLNLSRTAVDQKILDPFCGSGTIIQEALLLGYKNIIGSDVSKKAVEFTQNNLKWLKTKLNVDLSGVEVYQLDVKKLSEKIRPESINTVITEPYLGPSLKISNPAKVIKDLSKLYLSAFEEFFKVLKKGGKVVIIFPIVNNQKLDVLNDIKRMGFIIEPLGEEPRRSIIYSRPGQRVQREIFVFRRN